MGLFFRDVPFEGDIGFGVEGLFLKVLSGLRVPFKGCRGHVDYTHTHTHIYIYIYM